MTTVFHNQVQITTITANVKHEHTYTHTRSHTNIVTIIWYVSSTWSFHFNWLHFYLWRYRLDSNIKFNCLLCTCLRCQYIKSDKINLRPLSREWFTYGQFCLAGTVLHWHEFCRTDFSNHVRLAATNALLNSLEFTKANFDKEVSGFYFTIQQGHSDPQHWNVS